MVIHDLKYEKNIEIEKTGKGRSVVTLSKSHYKCIILSQINHEKTCKKLNLNPDQAIIEKSKSFNNKVWLTDLEYKYLSYEILTLFSNK